MLTSSVSTVSAIPAASAVSTAPVVAAVSAMSSVTTVPAMSTVTAVPAMSTVATVPTMSSVTAVPAMSTVSSTARPVSASQNSDLQTLLSQLDPSGIFAIPGPSQVPSSLPFSVQHLQKHGLDNDGNICFLLAVILTMHRMEIVDGIHNPLRLQSHQDYIDQIFIRVLKALPSRSSFSLQLLRQVWNAHQTIGYSIQPNDDAGSCADNILSSLR